MNQTKPRVTKHAETTSNDELPIQLKNDALGCPRCHVELTNRKSRVFVEGIAIGMFDSTACEFCGFFLLTEKGFDESAKVIKLFGLDRVKQDVEFVHSREPDKTQMESDSTIVLEQTWQQLMSINPNPSIHKQIVYRTRKDEWDDANMKGLPLIANPPSSTVNKPLSS